MFTVPLFLLLYIVLPLTVVALFVEYFCNRIRDKSLAETNRRLDELTRLLYQRLPQSPPTDRQDDSGDTM